MGALGLALKMLILQTPLMLLQLAYATNILNISFWKYFFHQVASIFIFWIIAFGIHHTGAGLLLSVLAYGAIVGAMFIFIPNLFGLRREEFQLLVSAIRSKFDLT